MCVWGRAVLFVAFLLLPALSQAASLQVSPVSIQVAGPGASAIINLRNEGKAPLNAQIRVFRWIQVNGKETLAPTDDVVASPPIVRLDAKTDYTVRLVRVTKRPVSGEESYLSSSTNCPIPQAGETA